MINERGVQQALIDAVRAAHDRGAELGAMAGRLVATPEPASSALPVWLKATADGVEITLYAARREEIWKSPGEHDGAFETAHQRATGGGTKTNAAVIAFVAERCGVAKTASR